MAQPVDLADIQAKLIEKLKPSGWASKLRAFINSSDFENILTKLLEERDNGKRFTPPLKIAFRAFEECPIDLLKVVFINSEPYAYLGVADGLAFSQGVGGIKLDIPAPRQIALENILNKVEETVYNGFRPDQTNDLTRWANQGVLLLNMALTTQVDKPFTHAEIWNHFTMYVLDILGLTTQGLVFVLFGKSTHSLEEFIGSSNFIIKVGDPGDKLLPFDSWDCGNLFNKINQVLNGAHLPEITW